MAAIMFIMALQFRASRARGGWVLTAALATALLPPPGIAETWLMLSPGPGYRMEFSVGNATRFEASPLVARQGLSPSDQWFQVAPGGAAVALWSEAKGLAVFRPNGDELFRRIGVTAFRFAPDGRQIALATSAGIETLTLGESQTHVLARTPGAGWIQWTDAGLVVRAGAKLLLLDATGRQRDLAVLPPGSLVIAAKQRAIYFAPGSMFTIDLAARSKPVPARLPDRVPVINAELSPDGSKVLFATAAHVFLRENDGPVRHLVNADDVRSLSFSSDGASYLWAPARGGGELVTPTGKSALPEGTLSARFDRSRSGVVVVTSRDGVAVWKPGSGPPSVVGGISPDDGVNYTGDVLGDHGVVALYFKKSGEMKETGIPRSPRR